MSQGRVIWEETKNDYHECWKKVDRRNFVPREKMHEWMRNAPVRIGNNQTTSQPTLITRMLTLLFTKYSALNGISALNRSLRILDIGSGSGIVTALLACIIGNTHKTNKVIGIEIFGELVSKSKDNVRKIPKNILEHFAKIEFHKYDVYDLFNDPGSLGKFDLIYVGAEAKTLDDIRKFKEGIPKLLKIHGVAVAPIEGQIQIWDSKSHWIPTNLRTRFVPLERKVPKPKTHIGGKSRKRNVVEQKRLIREERNSRYSIECEKLHPDKICKKIAVTSRSAKIYKNHLFPDFSSMREIEKWAKDKCIIDVGSGINTSYDESFISQLAQKDIGIDILGIDLKAPKTKIGKREKKGRKTRKARFLKGDVNKIKLNQLKLDKKCKTNILLINNFLYLWIDDPPKLKRIFKNLFSWLTPGSQIRIFPVYFGRYDMFNKDLKDFLEKHCEIEIYTPEYAFGNLYEWHRKTNKRVSINEDVKFETKINRKLDAKTVILTIKKNLDISLHKVFQLPQ